jgi:hypothetical protein
MGFFVFVQLGVETRYKKASHFAGPRRKAITDLTR